MRIRTLVIIAALCVVAGCRTVAPSGEESDKSAFGAASGNTPKTAAMIIGGVVAASGPVVAIGGIALNNKPAEPPVAAFVAGGALTTLGIATILVANAVL